MASYLLKEDGFKFILETGAGFLVLEISVPSIPASPVDDGAWYMHAQAAQQRPRRKPKPLPVPHVSVLVDPDDWTDDELEFLLALDILEAGVTDG